MKKILLSYLSLFALITSTNASDEENKFTFKNCTFGKKRGYEKSFKHYGPNKKRKTNRKLYFGPDETSHGEDIFDNEESVKITTNYVVIEELTEKTSDQKIIYKNAKKLSKLKKSKERQEKKKKEKEEKKKERLPYKIKTEIINQTSHNNESEGKENKGHEDVFFSFKNK